MIKMVWRWYTRWEGKAKRCHNLLGRVSRQRSDDWVLLRMSESSQISNNHFLYHTHWQLLDWMFRYPALSRSAAQTCSGQHTLRWILITFLALKLTSTVSIKSVSTMILWLSCLICTHELLRMFSLWCHSNQKDFF